MRLLLVITLALAVSCTDSPGVPQMPSFPETKDALVLRTDFTSDAAWSDVRTQITTPVNGFQAYIEFVDNPQYDGLTVEQLLEIVPDDSAHTFMFLVDRTTISSPEHPVLVVDLRQRSGRTFRVIPSKMWSVENNLSLANLDWEDFANSTDKDGVFRGFPK